MRIRARDVRTRYEWLWRCCANNPVKPFELDLALVEGGGDAHVHITNFLDYISAHEEVGHLTLKKINADQFKPANVLLVSSFMLLRIRARDVRAYYVRL